MKDKLQLDWYNAISHARNKGKFIPNSEKAKELGLDRCWTSTTCKGTAMARVHGEAEPVLKTETRPVILVDDYKVTMPDKPTDKKLTFVEWLAKDMKTTNKKAEKFIFILSCNIIDVGTHHRDCAEEACSLCGLEASLSNYRKYFKQKC